MSPPLKLLLATVTVATAIASAATAATVAVPAAAAVTMLCCKRHRLRSLALARQDVALVADGPPGAGDRCRLC
jgi:hypothetical protein